MAVSWCGGQIRACPDPTSSSNLRFKRKEIAVNQIDEQSQDRRFSQADRHQCADDPVLRGDRIASFAGRQAGNQRVYTDADVKSLTFIRRCREFGFSIDQVRSLVALVQDPASPCVQARDLAQEHLVAVRAKLAELKALERSLAAFVTSCDTSCAGGAGPDCVIFDDLSPAAPFLSMTVLHRLIAITAQLGIALHLTVAEHGHRR